MVSGAMIWVGIGLVLTILIKRWHLGVWDIDSDQGPPSPSLGAVLLLLLGVILVGWGSIRILADY